MSDTGPADFFASLAKGAAAGAALGPIGAAAGAGVAAVAEIADATGLTKWLFGPNGQQVATAAQAAVQAVTGTADPKAQAQTLQASSDAQIQLRVEFARIAAAQEAAHEANQLETLRAGLADVHDARTQTLQLAGMKSVLAWGAPVISIVVLVGYALVTLLSVWLIAAGKLDAIGSNLVTFVLGNINALAASVCSYWVGSSAGSAAKDGQIERMTVATKKP